MTTLTPTLVQRFLVGGKVFSYAAGTTTKVTTYTDSTGVTPNTNPIILNARGEADIWILPNVGYKFTLSPSDDTDPPTNAIWTKDNIVNSQLITLYGGVDAGIANAYVLTFSANFSAYTDGIVLYWTPANTNTTSSTVNLNGLGIINIVNPDGSNLQANEIVANQPAIILYKTGTFTLITPGTIYSSFTATWIGFGGSPPGNSATFTLNYRKIGNLVTLIFPSGTGTSTATSFGISGLPATIIPGLYSSTYIPLLGMQDGGVTLSGGVALVNNTSSINFYKDGTLALWTASGAKGFAVNGTMTYPL
jgi:hypothetical protein